MHGAEVWVLAPFRVFSKKRVRVLRLSVDARLCRSALDKGVWQGEGRLQPIPTSTSDYAFPKPERRLVGWSHGAVPVFRDTEYGVNFKKSINLSNLNRVQHLRDTSSQVAQHEFRSHWWAGSARNCKELWLDLVVEPS